MEDLNEELNFILDVEIAPGLIGAELLGKWFALHEDEEGYENMRGKAPFYR